jgi:uncharacterized membrane protein
MDVSVGFLIALAAMAFASYACRIGGYVLMGYIPITPRVEAALKAIPLGVMIGIATPTAASGRIPELAGLAAVGIVMKLARSDLAAALAGAATVAVCRWAGL